MSNRTWVLILVFGLGAVILLGMSMQFVVKSSPGLQAAIKFKQSMARDFASRGIEEVALRNLKKGVGYHLLLTATLPESETDRERLDEEVADYFVRTHPNTRARYIKVSYHSPPSWGCRSASADPHRVREIQLAPIRRRIQRMQKQTQLTTQLEARHGVRLLSCELKGEELTLRVEVPPAETPRKLQLLARTIERDARGRLRWFYATLRLILVEKPPAAQDGKQDTTQDGEQGTTQDGEQGTTQDGKQDTPLRENVLFDGRFDSRGRPQAGKSRR